MSRLTWLSRVLGVLTTVWILYTLYSILRYGGAVVVDPDTTSRIMGVRNGDVLFSAVGLTYHGFAGAVLVLTEVVVVTAALLVALFSSGRRRLSGLLILMAWTAVWLGNALWLRSLGWQHGTSTIGMALALVAAVGWWVTAAVNREATPGRT